MSKDGNEAYFTRSNFNNSLRVILKVQKIGTAWGIPEVASFSGEFNDLEPFMAPDGNTLFFASNRNEDQTAAKKDFDIWYVRRQENGSWGRPVHTGPAVNSPRDEYFPSVAGNGNLYFTATREGGAGSEDIFVAECKNGVFQTPKALEGGVNSETYEFNAYVNPEETLLIFSSYGRPDDSGGGDLYYSTREGDGPWNPAINLGKAVNTTYLDYCPFYHAPTQTLYYTSNFAPPAVKIRDAATLDQMALGLYNQLGNIFFVKLDKSFFHQ